MSLPNLSNTFTMITSGGSIFANSPVLANELWLKIFVFFFSSLPTFKAGKIIDAKYFGILLAHGILSKLRRISKTLASLAFQAFYEVYEFKFFNNDLRFSDTISLPSSFYHKCLRRIQVVVRLSDAFFTMIPGADTSLPGYQQMAINAIVSASELFAHCSGARTLLALSRMIGLQALDLTIFAGFRNPEAALAVYKSAGIAVDAVEVKLAINPECAVAGEEDWPSELVQALGFDLGGFLLV
jgi:hypothetical protein